MDENGKTKDDYPSLDSLARKHGFILGASCNYGHVQSGQTYLDFAGAHFSSLTCTNEGLEVRITEMAVRNFQYGDGVTAQFLFNNDTAPKTFCFSGEEITLASFEIKNTDAINRSPALSCFSPQAGGLHSLWIFAAVVTALYGIPFAGML